MVELSKASLLLQGITYEDVIFPDAGSIRLHPYISFGASHVMSPDRDDTTRMFEEFYNACAEIGKPVFDTLSASDILAIARHYCVIQDCLTDFDERRANENVFDAFRNAYCSTASWIASNREHKRMLSQLQVQAKQMRSGLISHFSADLIGTNKTASMYASAIPAIRAADILRQGMPLNRALNSLLFPTLPTLLLLKDSIASSYANWRSYSQGLANEVSSSSMITARHRDLDRMVRGTVEISKILHTVPPLKDALSRVMLLSNTSSGDIQALSLAARDAVRYSESIVADTNRYFSRIGRPSHEPQPEYPTQSRMLRELDEEIQSSFSQSESSLHVDASDSIILSNSVLIAIKDQCGEAIDEKMSPFSDLLERLNYLSKPPSFMEVLTNFSVSFGNLHWKAIWDSIGEKFKTRPEQIAQAILASHLDGFCYGKAFVGRELGSGAGYVDLLVNFLGVNFIIEIKIVGPNWGIQSARDGLDQLDAYMQTYSNARSYLVVFDGRKTTRGEQLESSYLLSNGSVDVVIVKSYYEAPTS